MKTKILITSLGLIATSVYAQPSIPAGASQSSNRPDVSREAPSMPHQSGPQPSRPEPSKSMGSPQPAIGATGGNGGNGGNGGLIIGTGGTGGAGGSGAIPMPANNAKAPTSVGATGLATPLPKGVGPTPLKNDDVGTNSYVLFIPGPPPPEAQPVTVPVTDTTAKLVTLEDQAQGQGQAKAQANAQAKAQKLEKAAQALDMPNGVKTSK